MVDKLTNLLKQLNYILESILDNEKKGIDNTEMYKIYEELSSQIDIITGC